MPFNNGDAAGGGVKVIDEKAYNEAIKKKN